ncbi:MAG TPA: helix-hairpin-helix domain-containing protein, partial [Actinoplanes sp.]|nr:helix-hairpin-helix domain-containing protein [Actinoplanes sp.]
MGWFISQSLVFIVLAFILGVVAGRLWRNAPEKPTEPPAEPDRFERIEGIGPAMANALRAAGISTFTQLAESDDDTKRTALKAAGLSFAPSLVTWSRQARLLADGDEAAFAVLTARLIAGRDTDQQGPRPPP